MKKLILVFFAVIFMAFNVTAASAATIELWDHEIFADGSYFYQGNAQLIDGAFDWTTGLGSLSIKFSPGVAGTAYEVFGWFDHDLYDDNGDGVYDDESAQENGARASNALWMQDGGAYELDDDGDWSMEIGYYDIVLAADEYALVTFILGTVQPGGFYISQNDDPIDSDGNSLPKNGPIYLSSTIEIGTNVIPEPATLLLFGIGLLGISGMGRRKK